MQSQKSVKKKEEEEGNKRKPPPPPRCDGPIGTSFVWRAARKQIRSEIRAADTSNGMIIYKRNACSYQRWLTYSTRFPLPSRDGSTLWPTHCQQIAHKTQQRTKSKLPAVPSTSARRLNCFLLGRVEADVRDSCWRDDDVDNFVCWKNRSGEICIKLFACQYTECRSLWQLNENVGVGIERERAMRRRVCSPPVQNCYWLDLAAV